MEYLSFNGHVLEMYSSITMLPADRFQEYNFNVFVDSEIGSDIPSFDARCNNVRALMRANVDQAELEITNLMQCYRFIISRSSPELNSFCFLINKIDGRLITDEDLTEDGIKRLQKELGKKGFTIDAIRDFLKGFKKKIAIEFETYLPGLADSASIREFYAKLKQRATLLLRQIIEKRDLEDQINKIDSFFIESISPKNFYGSRGVEAVSKNGFEDTCLILSQNNMSLNPRKMTTLSFFRALQMLKKNLSQDPKNDKRDKRKKR